MKVLQVISSLHTGGAEKLLVESAPLYERSGLEMDVLLLNGTPTPLFKILKEAMSGKIFTLSQGSFYNPMFIFRLVKYLGRYDVIHVHLFPCLYFVALAKLISRSKTPLVFTEHNTNNKRINNFLFNKVDRLIYSLYSKVVCISEEIEDIVHTKLCLSEQKLTVITNGINLETIWKALPHTDLSGLTGTEMSKFKVLIQVSRFDAQKDQSTLIKALLHLPADVVLLLVGEGKLRKQAEALTKALHLEARVFFLGVRMDVPQLLKSADVVVLSSNYEGVSLSMIEGMASGRPFVASDVPGLTNIVSGAGLLFPKGDDRLLAEQISKLLLDKDFYKQTAGDCLARSKSYDVRKTAREYITLYGKLSLNK